MLLAACAAPPTHEQSTSRAIARNCEAQADIAADDVKKENVQVVKEGGAGGGHANNEVEIKAKKVREDTFKACMLKYSV